MLDAPGEFSTGQLDRELFLSAREATNIRAVPIDTLCKEWIIEKAGDRRGYYRLVDKETAEVDFVNAPELVYIRLIPFQNKKASFEGIYL
ncbi:MAG: hypothetical protein JRG73_11660 [Deltaproteobacteria bacterium]|nr:hypothetical protein [Deltaproteobacteria bacterium]